MQTAEGAAINRPAATFRTQSAQRRVRPSQFLEPWPEVGGTILVKSLTVPWKEPRSHCSLSSSKLTLGEVP
jgi:hypothetical protein